MPSSAGGGHCHCLSCCPHPAGMAVVVVAPPPPPPPLPPPPPPPPSLAVVAAAAVAGGEAQADTAPSDHTHTPRHSHCKTMHIRTGFKALCHIVAHVVRYFTTLKGSPKAIHINSSRELIGEKLDRNHGLRIYIYAVHGFRAE